MKVYVKGNELERKVQEYMGSKDVYTLDEILGGFEELLYEYNKLEEAYTDYKEYVGTYKQDRTHWTASEMAEYYSNEE